MLLLLQQTSSFSRGGRTTNERRASYLKDNLQPSSIDRSRTGILNLDSEKCEILNSKTAGRRRSRALSCRKSANLENSPNFAQRKFAFHRCCCCSRPNSIITYCCCCKQKSNFKPPCLVRRQHRSSLNSFCTLKCILRKNLAKISSDETS